MAPNYQKVNIPFKAKDLVSARKKAGLTQHELAALTGLNQAYIAYIEKGRVKSIRKQTKDKILKIIQF